MGTEGGMTDVIRLRRLTAWCGVDELGQRWGAFRLSPWSESDTCMVCGAVIRQGFINRSQAFPRTVCSEHVELVDEEAAA